MKVLDCYELPENLDSNVAYRLLPKNTDEAYYWERVDRNIGWITKEEQEILRHKTIGIAGCGGMGGFLGQIFVRLGVGEVRICDSEVFDVSNINRQYAANKLTVNKSKALETARMTREIADDFTLVVFPQGIAPASVDQFLDGCDVVADEIELLAVASRILLHQRARHFGIDLFNCNTLGFGSRLFLYTPKSTTMEECLGLSYEEALDLQEKMRRKEASEEERFKVIESTIRGLLPELPEYYRPGSKSSTQKNFWERLLQEGKALVISTNPPLATGLVADRILLHLLRGSRPRRDIKEVPEMPGYLYIDVAKIQIKVKRGKWW